MARKRLPEKLYRIGEIMGHSGLSRQTLNFYATMGLIREQQRTPAGHRLFPASVFADLERVRGLQKKGYTLQRIREMLEQPRQHRGRMPRRPRIPKCSRGRTRTDPLRFPGPHARLDRRSTPCRR
jgi:DNA-binding transcriptional MerR regulator